MLTVYKASAGSGKTYTLTYEYIKLLLGHKNEDGTYSLNKTGAECHRAILAITFTNKATAEMKQRIINELAVLAQVELKVGEESPYTENLTKVFGCSVDDLQKVAYKALLELLFDFGFFNVSTIDSFFQNVLRIFAREAELTGNYEVELSEEYAIDNGVNEVLSSLNMGTGQSDEEKKERRWLSDWLGKYMRNLVDEGGGFNMFNRASAFYEQIVSFVHKMCDEEFKLNSEPMMKYLANPSKIIAFEQAIARKEEEIMRDAKEKAMRAINILGQMGLTPNDCLNQYVRTQLISWASGKAVAPSDTVKKAMNNQEDLSTRYLKAYAKEGALPATFDIAYLDAIETMCRSYLTITTYKLTRNNIYILGLLGSVSKKIEEYRNENNLILLSDTNDILQRIISEDELPFIYERVGTNLQHFLVDEFQDTSRMQWQNLRPLISESLSHNHDNLIIGDEKQCIYRFRNSDPSLLKEQVQTEFRCYYEERGNDISENTNWRSSADVVRFNNTIFAAIAESAGLSEMYKNVVQQIAPKHKNHRGYVLVSALDGNVAEFAEQSLAIMAEEIKRQLLSGYKASDIAILVSKWSEGRKAIDYMLDYMARTPDCPSVNILSNEALNIANSNAVRLIISVLRYLDAPDEAPDKYHVAAREFSRLINRYEYYISHGHSHSQALSLSIPANTELDGLAAQIKDMECISLPSIVERIIKRYVSEDILANENIYILTFQDIVVDFCSRGTGDIHLFLKWWDKFGYKTSLTFPDTVDAIKVMTIHKSKGLEFKCVHIPFAVWEMKEDEKKNKKWFDTTGIYEGIDAEIVPPILPMKVSKAMQGTSYEAQYKKNLSAEFIDKLNLTYVAFTRAVNELIINCNIPNIDKNGNINKRRISDCIALAIDMADNQYVASKQNAYAGKSSDVFVDLKGNKKSETVLVIGEPTVNIPDKIQRTEEQADSGEEKPKDEILVRKGVPYFTADRDDMWNLSRVEDLQDMDAPRERGIILHDILGAVHHLDDLRLAVRRHAYRYRISDEEADDIYRFLNSAISDERVKRWFCDYYREVKERTIIMPNGDRYRPDRVVWTKEGSIEVIDYKFGEQRPKKYISQVRGYMNLLQEMGYENLKGYIWYLDSGEIVEVAVKD